MYSKNELQKQKELYEQQAYNDSENAKNKLNQVKNILYDGIHYNNHENFDNIWDKHKDYSEFTALEFNIPISMIPLNLPPKPIFPKNYNKIPEEINNNIIQTYILSELKKVKNYDNPFYKTLNKNGNISFIYICSIIFFNNIIIKEDPQLIISIILISIHFIFFIIWKKRSTVLKKQYKRTYEEKRKSLQQQNVEIEFNFEKEKEEWLKNKIIIENKNKSENEILLIKNKVLKEQWDKDNNLAKNNFIKNRDIRNNAIDKLKLKFIEGDLDAVKFYFNDILNNSEYPGFIKKEFAIDYNPESKIIYIDYFLPKIEDYPKISEVRYIASKKEIKNYYLSNKETEDIFDKTCYNISLRTIYEILNSDKYNIIDMVSFNGWIRTINKAKGKEENICILSLIAKKDEFLDIDLTKVDPKTCFKSLKGVGSSKLSGLAGVKPIITQNKHDKRFIESYDVIDSLENTQNLAEMDWEDFEHLIREIFEREFSGNGGEVKVTQASKDGGVDAVIFDPDPIRGGKIIVQAKRYTNVVGVSAVRDLYGTVMNEGAMKGILVTTADYGPDAYEFIKGKPLTLMNGGNLLYLLEKHGHKARVDIKEARKNLYGK